MSLINKYEYDMELKLRNFPKYVSRIDLSRFLARYELFKMTMDVKGSIVEGGVFMGGGVMSWAKLSAAFEPYALHRKVIGFDTFEGFVEIHPKDGAGENNESLKPGGFFTGDDIYKEILESVEEFDKTRYLNQYEKVELVKGDVSKTIPQYLEDNPHLIISLLFLDFDLYEPTKIALENLLSRVPKGGIVAFDEINNKFWPGETVAVFEKFGGFNNIEIKKFPFDPNIAYVQL